MPLPLSLPGLPPLLLPIPNLPDVSGIIGIPNIGSLLNVTSIPGLQAIPNVTSLLNVTTVAQIPDLPNVGELLNVPDLSSLIRIPSLPQLLDMAGVGDLLTGDNVPSNQVLTPQWGIFLDGEQVLFPDSMVSLEYKKDYRIVDYPMEEGAFQSYNKVTTPYDARIRVTKGGTIEDRQAFLQDVAGIAESLDLYDLITPEVSYSNANVMHVDYRRTATNGVGLLSIDLWLIEIRSTVTPILFSKTQAPSGADPVQLGQVQPQIPSLAQIAAITRNSPLLNLVTAGH